MNGENFKTFVNGNFNVIDFNIFLRLDNGKMLTNMFLNY